MALIKAAVADKGELEQTDQGIRNITETWELVVDDIEDGFDIALTGLPSPGVAHPDIAEASVRSYSGVTRTGPKSYTAQVFYSDEIGTQGTTPNNPLSWPVQWSVGFEPREDAFEIVPGSMPEKEVRNSAGDWFENQPTFPTYLAVLSIQQNITSLSLNLIRNTVGKTNQSSFLSLPSKNVLCRSIRGSGPQYYGTTSYVAATYDFLIDRDEHVITLLSQGYNEFVGGQKKKIKQDDTKRPITRPQNLDAQGAKTTGNAAKLPFKMFEETSFSVFGLSLSNLVGLSS